MKKSYMSPSGSLLCFLLWISVILPAFSQSTISIKWNSETGCREEIKGRKEYSQEIEPSECVRICEFSYVTYSLTGNDTSNSAGWINTQWNVGGGSISSSNLTQCNVVWGSAGSGLVSATITKSDGTQFSTEVCIEVIKAPKANFGVSPYWPQLPYETCVGQVINFSNLSTADGGTGITNSYWDFGDGTTSSLYNPTHTYNAPGVYPVKLTVTNACFCTDTYSGEIKVGDYGFNIDCPGVVCEGKREVYSLPPNAASACNQFVWKVEGGTIVNSNVGPGSVMVEWDDVDESGFGYVTFDSNYCQVACPGVTTIKVPVIQSEGTIQGETTVCGGNQFKYSLPQWPATQFNWNLTDGGTNSGLLETDQPNEIVLQAGENNGQVILTCTYVNTLLNCGGTATITINVLPLIEIQGNDEVCKGNSETYSISTTANWTLTDDDENIVATGTGTTFNHNFSQLGSFRLRAETANACPAEDMIITVHPSPGNITGITGPSVVCPGSPATFSVDDSEPGTVIEWEVVNGQIQGSSFGDEVSVLFNSSGPFQVKAVRKMQNDPQCESPVFTKNVSTPVVNIPISGPATVCPNSEQSYHVPYADGEVYTWTILEPGVGNVISGNGTKDVSVIWNNATTTTTATLQLEVRKCSQVYTSQYTVTVQVPTFTVNTPTQICRGQVASVSLTANPGIGPGTVTWDFGDGSTATGLSASHVYNAAISSNVSYIITATVQGAGGCDNTYIFNRTIEVVPAPKGLVSSTNGIYYCGSFSEDLVLTLQSGYGATTGIKWYYQNNLVATNVTTYTATQYGTYYVKVTNAQGCETRTNSITIQQTCGGGCEIDPYPTVTLNAQKTSCNTFSASGTFTGSPVSVTWNTVPSTGVTISNNNNNGAQFSVTTAGNYLINYWVNYNAVGGGLCTQHRTAYVEIPYIPEVKYSVSCGSTPGTYSVTLHDHTDYYSQASLSSKQFMINGTGQGQLPGSAISQTFTLQPGNYTVGIQVNGSGGPCSAYTTLALPALPTAHFTADNNQVCPDEPVSFTNTSTGGGNLQYHWDFNGEAELALEDGITTFDSDGPKYVTLTVTNQYGCSSQYALPITVKLNNMKGRLGDDNMYACKGDQITLLYQPTQGTQNPVSYTWMQGTQEITSTTTNTFNVTQNGSYWVKVYNADGCMEEISTVNAIFINPPVARIKGPDVVCADWEFELSGDAGGDDIEYTWYRNGSQIASGDAEITQQLTNPGVYTYKLVTSISQGQTVCSDSDTFTVTVLQSPGTPYISVDPVDCDNYLIKLSASLPTSMPGTYTWSNGATGQTIQVNTGGPYKVTFTNNNGCTSSAEVYVPEDPNKYLWIFPTGCYSMCAYFNNPYVIGPIIPFNKWAWNRNGSVDQIGSGMVPDYTLNGNNKYSLMLDNGLCNATSGDLVVDLEFCLCEIDESKIKKRGAQLADTPYCAYDLVFVLDNPYSTALSYVITADNGNLLFTPSSGIVNPSSNTLGFEAIPVTPFYTTTTIDIVIDFTFPDGSTCRLVFPVTFPGCGVPKGGKLADGSSDAVQEILSSGLKLVPNPAGNYLSVNYSYATPISGHERSLEIYDMSGRKLGLFNVTDSSNTWQPDISAYSDGTYIVVMKEDGQILKQQRLIVKH
ncbi:PKD domain-containing protein [Flavobacterium rhizosphaerae]|uniref:PKD domain-containing protein n=1 Tax=Flavobacterium rhizosphaerae TaxID=3163298 RepID=A0ABW8YWJ2_9FLAO